MHAMPFRLPSNNISVDTTVHVSDEAHFCYARNLSIVGTNDVSLYNCSRGEHFLPSRNLCFTTELVFPDTYPNMEDAAIVYGYFYPFFVLLTVIANIFVVLVLSKKHMASPTNTLLLYMATADLFLALVPMPFKFLFFIFGMYRQPESIAAYWCWLYSLLVDALPPICHNIAIWLTVLLAGQRFIYINYPVRSQQWCTLDNVQKATVSVIVVSLIAGLPKACIYSNFLPYRPNETFGCNPETQELFRRPSFGCVGEYTSFYELVSEDTFFTTYFTVRILCFVIIPSVLLILLNALLIIAIRKASQRRRRLLTERRRVPPPTNGAESAWAASQTANQRQNNSTSLMLVLIVTIFIIVNLPQGIILLLILLNAVVLNNSIEMSPSAIFWIFSVDNLLILATYPLNFAIYCSMSAQFRETFKRLFCPKLPPLPVYLRRASSYYLHTSALPTVTTTTTTTTASSMGRGSSCTCASNGRQSFRNSVVKLTSIDEDDAQQRVPLVTQV